MVEQPGEADVGGPYRSSELVVAGPQAVDKRPVNARYKRWFVEGVSAGVLAATLRLTAGAFAAATVPAMMTLVVYLEIGIFLGERAMKRPALSELAFPIVYGDKRSTWEPTPLEIERVHVTFSRHLSDAETAEVIAGTKASKLSVTAVASDDATAPTVLQLTGWSRFLPSRGRLFDLLRMWGAPLHARIPIAEVHVWCRDRPTLGIA